MVDDVDEEEPEIITENLELDQIELVEKADVEEPIESNREFDPKRLDQLAKITIPNLTLDEFCSSPELSVVKKSSYCDEGDKIILQSPSSKNCSDDNFSEKHLNEIETKSCHPSKFMIPNINDDKLPELCEERNCSIFSQDLLDIKHEVSLQRMATQYTSRMQAIPSHHKQRACASCGYCIQYLVYVSWIGRFCFCIIGFLPFINYSKDLWICGTLWHHRDDDNEHEMWFWITLSIFWASSRVLWMIKFDLESMRVNRLPFYILPGSVALDFKLEEGADWAVWIVWELLLFVAAPFSPLLLLYHAIMKVMGIVGVMHYEGEHTLAFNVAELGFETIPQLCVQSYLHFKYEHDVSTELLLVSIIICLLSLVKIPMLLIWNRSLIHGLAFKRHHTSVVKTVRFHPQLDVLASGSWDMTVLTHSVLVGSVIKAKRVAPCGSMQVNCIDFNRDGTLMAVGGHGLRIYDTEIKQYIKKLPKRKNGKRPRGDEMSHIRFTKDGRHLVCAEGTMIVVYDVEQGTKTQTNCIDRDHDSICAMALSPDNEHILTATATGKSIYVWKVHNLQSKEKFELEKFIKIDNAHMFTINCMEFTKDGQYFFTGSTDYHVKLWNFENPQEPMEMKRYKHQSGISCLSVGVMQLTETEAKELEIQDELKLTGEDSDPEQAYCTPVMTTKEVVRMGKAIIVTGGDQTVTIWDLITGERINQFTDIEGMVTSVDCSPFGDNLAFCTDNKDVGMRPLSHSIEDGSL